MISSRRNAYQLLALVALLLALPAQAQLTPAQIDVAGLGALVDSFDCEAPTGSALCLGVVFLDGEYYLTNGGGGAANMVSVVDGDGSLVRQFSQNSGTTFGYRDGATDGVSVMFGCEDGVYVHDSEGNTVTTVLADNGPQTVASPIAGEGLATLGIYRALAYNPSGNGGNGSLWTASFGSELLEIDLDGNILNQLSNNVGWSIYGLAWDPYTQTLLANSVPNAGDIAQIDPLTGAIGASFPRLLNPGSAQGGLSPVVADDRGAWLVAAMDQATPDTVVTYRVHLYQKPFRNGYEEGLLLTGVGAEVPNDAPIKTIPRDETLTLVVEDLPGEPSKPVLYYINEGADALVNGVTELGRSGNVLPELVALHGKSTPVGDATTVEGRTGDELTLPVPTGLSDGDYLRVQAVTINPHGLAAKTATNQMFFQYSSCAAVERFDTTPQGTGVYPFGWSDGGGVREWTVDDAGTPSSGTGPSTAVSQPNYMYCETSSPAATGDTFILNTAVYPSSSLSQGQLSFQLSRVGATIGTLEVRMDDGSGTFSTLLASYTGPEPGGAEWTEEVIPLPGPLPANVQFQFHYTRGTSFEGDIAIDDFCLE